MHATRHAMTGHAHEPLSVIVRGSLTQDHLLHRVRSEFREMPGMRLTLDQARRLWTLDRDTCASVLNILIAAKFLEVDINGRYRKAHCGY